MGEYKNNTIKMPAHIFGELSYTEQGFRLLQSHNFIDYFVQQIRNDNAPVQQKRSALWAIGQIGQSKNGVKLIRDRDLFPDLVRMAEQYPVLSLRGTCLYTLNMICTTSTGRKELEKFQWISHMNSNLGWLCIPKNIYQFFYIRMQVREGQKSFWPLQEEVHGCPFIYAYTNTHRSGRSTASCRRASSSTRTRPSYWRASPS